MTTRMHTDQQRTTLGDIDSVRAEDLRRLAEQRGPCVSITLATTPFGPGTTLAPDRLRRLSGRARDLLTATGVPDARVTAILDPLVALADDPPFWQHQASGLAVYASEGLCLSFRLDSTPEEQLVVGPRFRLTPLVPAISADDPFLILALGRDAVRLYEARRHSIAELDLGPIPGSLEQAVPASDAQPQRQSHSTGSGRMAFHGHGSESDTGKVELERYFRAVDDGLRTLLGPCEWPLVLACVGYYRPIFAAVSRYPALWPTAVETSPRGLSASELHAGAWPLVEEHFALGTQRDLDRYRQAVGTGLTVATPEQVATAAREGRIEVLFVGDPAGRPTRPADAPAEHTDESDQVDAAVHETLRHGGEVRPVATLPDETAIAALLRF